MKKLTLSALLIISIFASCKKEVEAPEGCPAINIMVDGDVVTYIHPQSGKMISTTVKRGEQFVIKNTQLNGTKCEAISYVIPDLYIM